MHISIEFDVERPPNTRPMYQLWYLGKNNIKAEGCEYLSKPNWKKLQKLYLGISYGI